MKTKCFIVFISLLISFNLFFVSYANTLTLNITSSKKSFKVGEKIEIVVDWQKGMQAADFILEYDTEKMKFIETDIGENYTNEKDNQLLVSWFSNNNEDRNSIKFQFEATDVGDIEIKSKVLGGFATGSLEIPDNYEEGNLQIKIKKSNLFIKILLLIFIFILFIKLSKKQKGKLRRKKK